MACIIAVLGHSGTRDGQVPDFVFEFEALYFFVAQFYHSVVPGHDMFRTGHETAEFEHVGGDSDEDTTQRQMIPRKYRKAIDNEIPYD